MIDLPRIEELKALAAKVTGRDLVKPLEWVEEIGRSPASPAWLALTATGKDYRVFTAWWGKEDKWGYVCIDSDPQFFHAPDEAKAAAQADYAQRIIAALDPETLTSLCDLAIGEAKPLADWNEGDGDVVWWTLSDNGQWFGEPAYIGSPLDLGRGYNVLIGEQVFIVHLGGWPGYHTHWTPHPKLPAPPTTLRPSES